MVGDNPGAALELARGITEPAKRDLAILHIISKSGSFSDSEVRRICTQELDSEASRDQCSQFLDRPHLRFRAEKSETTSSIPASLGALEVCGNRSGPSLDQCLYAHALDIASSRGSDLLDTISSISNDETRGYAVCGVLRRLGTLPELPPSVELESLVSLASGRFKDEAYSILGSDLPFRFFKSCLQGRSSGLDCEELLTGSSLPQAVSACAKAGDFEDQCFDHICSQVAEIAVTESSNLGVESFPERLESRMEQAVRFDSRVGHVDGCQYLWAGRKADQVLGNLTDADDLCGLLPDESAAMCRSGLAEVVLRRRLMQSPVADEQSLVREVTLNLDRAFSRLPPALVPFIPCAAFSVLRFELVTNLSGKRLPQEQLAHLALDVDGCAWNPSDVGRVRRGKPPVEGEK